MSRLRELRDDAGLKQDEIARMLGMSLPNYNKKENGEIKVSLSEAKKISDFYGLSIENIFFNNIVSKKETIDYNNCK